MSAVTSTCHQEIPDDRTPLVDGNKSKQSEQCLQECVHFPQVREPGCSEVKSYLSVIILCFINLINYMDRYTIAGVLTKVKEFFHLNEAEGGLLQTSFIISYMLMSPLFGYLGDRYSRKIIIICGVIFWSITTFLGSFIPADHAWGFYLLRALVGTGEASYSTIAPTIIADLFTSTMRTRMLAVFYFAIPVGSGLGYIVGSQMNEMMGSWNWALRVTPALGLLSVILAFGFLQEPPRGIIDGGAHLTNTNIWDDLKYILRIPSFIWSSLGFTCVSFASGALSWLVPTYISYGLGIQDSPDDIKRVGLIFGGITCFAGIFGVLLGSLGSQKYRQYSLRADPLLCAFSVLTSVPLIFFACIFVHRSITVSYVLMFFGVMFLCMNWPIVADMLLYVVIPTRRSIAEAVQIMMCHALGDASSPYIVGVIADSIKSSFTEPSEEYQSFYSLQYALLLLPFVLVIGGLFFIINSWYIIEDKGICETATIGYIQMPDEGSSNCDTSHRKPVEC